MPDDHQERMIAQGLRDGKADAWQALYDPQAERVWPAAERAELVRAALAELSADHALLLTAHYLDGEPVALIAARERSNEVAVRSKLARARKAFRDAFALSCSAAAAVVQP